jgi:hypothetical protein
MLDILDQLVEQCGAVRRIAQHARLYGPTVGADDLRNAIPDELAHASPLRHEEPILAGMSSTGAADPLALGKAG